MTLLRRVRGLIGDEGTVYECRHCGTTLESNTQTCPQCGRSEVVAYDIG
jgi:rubrerythrin